MSSSYKFIPYSKETYSAAEMQKRSKEFYEWANKRRTVRDFSSKEIPQEVIDNILLTANTAPSGANKQPWTFCVVTNAEIKKTIRIEAEKEEKTSYENRMSEEWLEDLMAIGTDWQNHFSKLLQRLLLFSKEVLKQCLTERSGRIIM